MTDLFASVPDRCPECDDPLDVQVDLTAADFLGTSGRLTLVCTACGWGEVHDV